MTYRKQIKMDSDPMWEALKCSDCHEMTFIQHRSSGEFEMYDCSCVKMQRQLSELMWEMYWESREGQHLGKLLRNEIEFPKIGDGPSWQERMDAIAEGWGR